MRAALRRRSPFAGVTTPACFFVGGCWFALGGAPLARAHTEGISQGTLLVQEGVGAGVGATVELELVFARADAARLPAAGPVVEASRCVVATRVAGDVEEDGHALRVQLQCAAAPTWLHVVGLAHLPEEHRLWLRLAGATGARELLLSPAAVAVPLSASASASASSSSSSEWGHSAGTRSAAGAGTAALLLALLALLWGSRQRRALLLTAAATGSGALLGVGLVAVAGVPVPGGLHAAVVVCGAAAALGSVLVDGAPRVRPAAAVLAAALVWWVAALWR